MSPKKLSPQMLDNVTVINDSEYYSGIGQYSSDLVESLRYLNYNVHYIHFGNARGLKGTFTRIDNPFQNFRFSSSLLHPIFFNLFAARRYLQGVVHLTSQFLIPLGMFRKRTIITVHDLIQMHYAPRDVFNGTLHILKLELLDYYEHIVTVSDFVKRDIIEHFDIEQSKITVIPNSVDLDIFRSKANTEARSYTQDKKKIVILHVGNDQRNKNVLLLYKVLKLLPDNFSLIRVGTNSYRNVNFLRKNNLLNRVKFFNRVDASALVNLYTNSDLFVYPSQSEGFGRPLLEAMACGLPVIYNDSSSLPEIAGDAGLKFEKEDVNEISELIYKALDEDINKSLRQKGVKRSEEFSKTNIRIKMKKLYEGL